MRSQIGKVKLNDAKLEAKEQKLLRRLQNIQLAIYQIREIREKTKQLINNKR